MLKTRVLTAAVALPLALALLIYGPSKLLLPIFALLVAVGTYEVAAMLAPRLEGIFKSGSLAAPIVKDYTKWPVYVAALIAAAIFVFSAGDTHAAGRGMILLGLLGSLLVGCFFSKNNELAFANVACLLISITYGAFPWLCVWELYVLGERALYVIFLVAVVWSGDTGAYFAGRRFGRHKLAPRMSPNKTIEGALAGLLSSVLAGGLLYLGYRSSFSGWQEVLTAAFFGGIFGQMGDLVESTLKRFSHVKDSGVLFPGHGGLLDRVDGVLFAAPVIWFVFYVM